MPGLRTAVLAALVALALVRPAIAKPVLDCPLRNAPFSIDLPLIDVLASEAARSLAAEAMPAERRAAIARPVEAPNFAAILTLRTAAGFTGMKAEALPALDAKLRGLPVTPADKLARCARYDDDVPDMRLPRGKPRLLLFEKVTGFKDVPSFDAAHAALQAMAARKGWALVATDKAGVFTPASLRRFDAVIWNNVSGDVLTLSQRAAFKAYMARGGGFVGLHGSAGDPTYFWDWYPDTLIGARFKGHPLDPQFQIATVRVNRDHPLAAALPAQWTMKDEWYSFTSDPRATGARVVLSLDESTYTPSGMGQDLRMGDHPIAWTRCIGKGRMFYSAIGHLPETYTQPQNAALIEAAIGWAAQRAKPCQ